jgi:hypothetical protein
MKKLILPMMLMAVLAVPATAEAASQCRNAKGQFAKCGTPGAMPAKGGPAMKPAMAPAMKPVMKPTMAPAMKPSPAMAPAKKKGPCKDSKGKFIKCAA